MASKSASPAALNILEAIGITDLPEDWDIVRVESLLCDDRGIAVGVMYPGEHDPAGIPLIKAGDLAGGRINPRPEFRITAEKHHEYRRTELAGGELLISLVGDVGRCALVPPRMAGSNAARAIAVLRCKIPSDTAFIRACLMSAPLQHLMQAWSTTTVQATLNLKEIRQIPLPWPPKKQRDAIAHILGTLDDKIELNRKMNETLEAMARGLFKSWFVDFEPVRAKAEGRDPGMPQPLADVFPARIVECEQGAIPEGWRYDSLGDLVDLTRGRTYKGSLKDLPGPVLLGLASIQRNGGFRDDKLSTYGGDSPIGLVLVPGDLFASLKDVTQSADLLGAVARVPDHVERGRLTQDTVKLNFKLAKASRNIVYLTLLTPEYREYCRSHATGTTNLGLSRDDFLAYPVVQPSEDIQRAFDTAIEKIEARAGRARAESRTLAALRATLLPRLVSGELRVGNERRFSTAAV